MSSGAANSTKSHFHDLDQAKITGKRGTFRTVLKTRSAGMRSTDLCGPTGACKLTATRRWPGALTARSCATLAWGPGDTIRASRGLLPGFHALTEPATMEILLKAAL